jgi:hypothetical protein
LDGGSDIPHSEKRFAGFSKEDKSLNAETHRKYILGGHLADYMKVQFLSFQAAITSPSTTSAEIFYKLYCPSPTRKSPGATILILFGGMGYSF